MLLTIGGLALGASSNDQRASNIQGYNAAVNLWNAGPGKSGASFQTLAVGVQFTNSSSNAITTSITQLVSDTTPVTIHDTQASDDEKFAVANNPKIFKSPTAGSALYDVYPKYVEDVDVVMKFSDIASSSEITFKPVKVVPLKYNWKAECSTQMGIRSESNCPACAGQMQNPSCSCGVDTTVCKNDCNNPSATGDDKVSSSDSCSDWCGKEGGDWTDAGNCYADDGGACCQKYERASSACVAYEDSAVIALSNCIPNDPNGGLVYSPIKMTDWNSETSKFLVTLRHKKDPWLTTYLYSTGCAMTSGCFGKTADEHRSRATGMLIPGGLCLLASIALLLIEFFCKKKTVDDKNHDFEMPTSGV